MNKWWTIKAFTNENEHAVHDNDNEDEWTFNENMQNDNEHDIERK